MLARQVRRVPALPLLVVASAVFAFSWLLRYNDPEGAYGGLTDDHFWYVVQGWQMLFGEWPDRDYVDPGAPLTLAISAVLQVLLGRSIWSESIFCVTALSLGAALTCALAARATGSIALGLAAALFEVALLPRLYNYPKIVVYAVAIGALWAWASSPKTSRTWLLALVTVVAFLLRHDHGAYVAMAVGILLLAMRDLRWLDRIRHGVIYGLASLLLLSPYLIYLQVNGGIERHFVTAYRWSTRDYDRSPLNLPTLTWQPLFDDPPSDAAESEWWNHAPFVTLATYNTWWLYWLITLLPPFVLLLLVVCPSTGPPGWPRERVKILVVTGLLAILNFRFLRGNLDGRFADVSVPVVILAAWSFAAMFRIARVGRLEIGPRALRLHGVARGLVAAVALLVAVITAGILARPAREAFGNSSLTEGLESALRDAEGVTRRLKNTWPLDTWADGVRGQTALARYLEACTEPTDSILVGPLMPSMLALAQRPFAGGHSDLRSGFFATEEEQQLTVLRLLRQSVPIVIAPPGEELDSYAAAFPVVMNHVNREYESLGDKDLGDGVVFTLFVRRDATTVRRYEPLSFPCFQ